MKAGETFIYAVATFTVLGCSHLFAYLEGRSQEARLAVDVQQKLHDIEVWHTYQRERMAAELFGITRQTARLCLMEAEE